MEPVPRGIREHGVADIAMLLAVVCVALAAWSSLADRAAVPLWKSSAIVGVSFFLALAALTRRSRWANTVRLAMGGWLIAAPGLLGFAGSELAFWPHVALGGCLAAASIPGLVALGSLRPRSPHRIFAHR